MTQEEFDYLHEGSIVQHTGTGNAYVVVTRKYREGKFTYEAARLVEISNPSEWEVIRK